MAIRLNLGDKDPTKLEFHHLYGRDKAISLRIAEGTVIEKIEKVIAKWQVLCCNCHREIKSKEQMVQEILRVIRSRSP